MKRFAILLLACLAAPATAAEDRGGMATIANGFYTTYLSLPRAGGIPEAAARARYAKLLSQRLNKQIADAAAAEARFQAKNKSSPPLMEGDLFSSLFEGISSFKLGECREEGNMGRCTASLTHSDPGQKPVSWTDELVLVNTADGWRVDDIAYKAGFAFGNTGRLSDTLTMALSMAQ